MEKNIRIICFKCVISHAYVHMGEKSREDNTKNILFNKKNTEVDNFDYHLIFHLGFEPTIFSFNLN